MKLTGYKQIALKSIVVDAPDIRRRAQLPHVAELAESIEAHGHEPIHAPTIRKGTNAIVCGRDRFAALLRNKAKRVWVHVAECTDDEAKQLELAENIYRRADNRSELLAQLVALKKPEIRAKLAKQRGDTVAPSEQTVTAEARKEVARAAGVKTASVKRAEQREKAKDSVPAGHAAQGDPARGTPVLPVETPGGGGTLLESIELPGRFETFGLPMSEVEKAQTRDAMASLAAWAAQASQMLTYLTRFEGQGAVVAAGHVQRIRERLQSLGHAYRDAIPVRLCYYCKGRPDLKSECYACGQTGLMGRNDGENAPDELHAKGPAAMVASGGAFVPYAGAPAKAAKAAAPTKKVKVLDEEGRDLTFVPDEEPAF